MQTNSQEQEQEFEEEFVPEKQIPTPVKEGCDTCKFWIKAASRNFKSPDLFQNDWSRRISPLTWGRCWEKENKKKAKKEAKSLVRFWWFTCPNYIKKTKKKKEK